MRVSDYFFLEGCEGWIVVGGGRAKIALKNVGIKCLVIKARGKVNRGDGEERRIEYRRSMRCPSKW